MRNITISLVALFGLLSPAMAAGPNINPATQINWTKVAGAGTPSASCVASIYGEPYTNTTNGDFYVCASTGWVLVAAGGGGTVTGSGTAGFLPIWVTGASIGNSLLDYNITNALKFTFSKGIVVSDGSGEAGVVGIRQGTAVSNTTNYVTLTGPTSITAYRIQLPGTAPTSGNTFLSCTAADPAVCTWAAGGGGGGGGYTNVTGSASETTVALINTACGSGTYYATTALSIATGGTINCKVQFSKSGLWTIAAAQTVTFGQPVTETDGPSQHFTGSGVVVMSPLQVTALTAWWGDVADFGYSAGAPVGTDDTAAIQACITAMSNGACLLQPAGHKITAAITIAKDSVTLEGPDVEARPFFGSSFNQNLRAYLAQVTAGTDALDVSSAGCCIIASGFRHLDFYSHNIASGTSNGVLISNVQAPVAQDSYASDFVNDFKFGHTAGYGKAPMSDLFALYGYHASGANYGTINLCGFNWANTDVGGYQSTYWHNITGAFSNGKNGTSTSASFCLSGTRVSDMNIDGWESAATMDYGWLVTTAAVGFNAYDINIRNGIADAQNISGVKVDTFAGQQLNLGNFTCNGMANSTKCVDIQSSSNVYIDGVTFMNGTSSLTSVVGINAASSSNIIVKNLNPQGNAFFRGTPVAFSGVTNSNVDGNFNWTDTHTGVALTSTSTGNVITGSFSGQGTGISFDATSGSNNATAVSFGSTPTTTVSDSGTGNKWCNAAGCGVPTQAADTVLMNATGGTSLPTAVAMPTCTSGAVLYNTSTHAWSCVSTGGSFPAPVIATPSGASTQTIAGCITSSNTDYEIRLSNINVSSAGADLLMQLSHDNGATFDTSVDYVFGGYYYAASAGVLTPTAGSSFNLNQLHIRNSTSPTAPFNARMTFYSPLSTTGNKNITSQNLVRQDSDGNTYGTQTWFVYTNTTQTINAFKIFTSAGTFSGTITCQPLP